MGVPPMASASLAMFAANPKFSARKLIGLIDATETVFSEVRVTLTSVCISLACPWRLSDNDIG